MKLRHALRLSLIALAVCVCTGAAAELRPNIVLIVADDLGFSDLGCYGGEIRTPHLDRLASEGLCFTQFYNCAVCNATRAALLTGVNPRFGEGGLLRANMVTMAEVLQQAGYATAMSGKWHLGGYPTRPIDRGFQEYYGVMIGAVNYFDPTLPDPPPMKHAGPPEPFVHNGTPMKSVPADYYATDAFTDHAVEQIRALSKGDRPFFLHLAYTAPHYPLQARPEDIARYRGRYQDGYEVLRKERYRLLRKLDLISKGWKLPDPDRKLGPWRYDLEPQSWDITGRPGLGIGQDGSVCGDGRPHGSRRWPGSGGAEGKRCGRQYFGRFLLRQRWLRKRLLGESLRGLSEGSADRKQGDLHPGRAGMGHGTVVTVPPLQNLDLRGRDYHADDRALAGQDQSGQPDRRRGPCGGPDADLPGRFGRRLPEAVWRERDSTHGRNEPGPVLLGGDHTPDRELGWYLYGSRAYRAGKWKIVWGVTAKRWELYDMEADRTETHDCAADHPDIVRTSPPHGGTGRGGARFGNDYRRRQFSEHCSRIACSSAQRSLRAGA